MRLLTAGSHKKLAIALEMDRCVVRPDQYSLLGTGMWRARHESEYEYEYECSSSFVEKHRVRDCNVLSSACHVAFAVACLCVALGTAG